MSATGKNKKANKNQRDRKPTASPSGVHRGRHAGDPCERGDADTPSTGKHRRPPTAKQR